ncbi:MAG: KEOPS complex kinase/ATPase Bud32 [archaeon]|nr:KEOPS complex kinase/ATPase Bud32 [archaeon]
MKVINVGAEARISLDGEVVLKERISKGYREKELDLKIRKFRTKREEKLMSCASRAGVMVPKIYGVKNFEISMEFIEGPRVKDMINKKNVKMLCSLIGQSAAFLHNSSIIHGDLTTSNMIYKDSAVYFIDFGLGFMSSKVEDKATDLHLLEEAMDSTHYEIASCAFSAIMDSYAKYCRDFDSVMLRLEQIRLRGRYITRNGV